MHLGRCALRGALAPSANRITLLRDTDGEGLFCSLLFEAADPATAAAGAAAASPRLQGTSELSPHRYTGVVKSSKQELDGRGRPASRLYVAYDDKAVEWIDPDERIMVYAWQTRAMGLLEQPARQRQARVSQSRRARDPANGLSPCVLAKACARQRRRGSRNRDAAGV